MTKNNEVTTEDEVKEVVKADSKPIPPAVTPISYTLENDNYVITFSGVAAADINDVFVVRLVREYSLKGIGTYTNGDLKVTVAAK